MKTDKKRRQIIFFSTILILLIICLSMILLDFGFLSTESRVNFLLKLDNEMSFNLILDMGENAIDPLITQLSNKERKIRERAALALGHIGDTRAVEPLISSLTDFYTCEEAVIALGMIGDERAIEPIVENYYHWPGLNDGWEVLDALEKLGYKKTINIALDIACNGRTEFSKEKGREVIRDATPQDIITLVGLQSCTDGETRNLISGVILNMGEAAVEPLISAAVSDEDVGAIYLLGRLKDNRAVEPLIELLLKDDCEHKSLITDILLTYNDSQLTTLWNAIEEWDLQTITKAYKFFISRGESGTEPQLIEALMLYGDHSMAYDYKLCDHEPLMKASDKWLSEKEGKMWLKLGNPSGSVIWGGD